MGGGHLGTEMHISLKFIAPIDTPEVLVKALYPKFHCHYDSSVRRCVAYTNADYTEEDIVEILPSKIMRYIDHIDHRNVDLEQELHDLGIFKTGYELIHSDNK